MSQEFVWCVESMGSEPLKTEWEDLLGRKCR